MNWNNLKTIKTKYLLGILTSIPIIIFALVYFLRLGNYLSDMNALGQRILIMSLILIGLYGFIVFASGFKFKQIGLSSRNIVLGLIYSGILYLAFHIILYLLITDKMQSKGTSEIAFVLPSFPFNLLIFAIILSVIWEEFIYRAFLLPHFQILFKKIGYNKSIVVSIFVTQIIFALHHLGNRVLIQHMDFHSIVLDQFSLVLIGTVLCFIYILSGNLTYTIMVHLFMDFPILFITGIKMPIQYLTFTYFLLGLLGAMIINENKKTTLPNSKLSASRVSTSLTGN